MARRLLQLAASIAIGLAPCAAAAQGHEVGRDGAGARPPLAETLTGAAKEAYESAGVLLNNRDFSGALDKYGQAYDLSRDPRLLFDMALCERDLRRYARMQKLLVRYEQEAGDRLDPAGKAEVDAALAAIAKLVGTVRLTVSEPGASVAVDGETVGTTPLPAPLVVDLGKHALSVTKEGFQPAEQTLAIAGGSEATAAITLAAQPRGARLHLRASPGDLVLVDRSRVAVGEYDGAVPAGPHTVQVSAPGKKTYDAQIDLREGETRELGVTLEAASRPSPWPWIVGGVVLAAGASVGGYFLLRPHDQHAPAPTGSLGTVTIPPAAWQP